MPFSAAWSRMAKLDGLVDLEAEGHGAEADARNLESGAAETNVLHGWSFPSERSDSSGGLEDLERERELRQPRARFELRGGAR